jgi:hypothetical protein
MTTIEQITTAERLLQALNLGRCELLRGQLIMMSPAGAKHGRIVVNVTVPVPVFITFSSHFHQATVWVYWRDGSSIMLQHDQQLSGEDVVSGFVFPVAKLFA